MSYLNGVVGTVWRERGFRGEAEGVASRPHLGQAEAGHRAGAEAGGVFLLQLFAAPKPAMFRNTFPVKLYLRGGGGVGLVLNGIRMAQADAVLDAGLVK